LEKYANDRAMMLEPDERRGNDNIAKIPVFINGNEAVAYITLNEARNRGILNLVEAGEGEDLSLSDLRDRMKKQFCELLILGMILTRSECPQRG
jgi:hypothetical protein